MLTETRRVMRSMSVAVVVVCAGLALFALVTGWHWVARLIGWVAMLMGLTFFLLTDARIPGRNQSPSCGR